jgi:hypothetical protein
VSSKIHLDDVAMVLAAQVEQPSTRIVREPFREEIGPRHGEGDLRAVHGQMVPPELDRERGEPRIGLKGLERRDVRLEALTARHALEEQRQRPLAVAELHIAARQHVQRRAAIDEVR